MGTKDRKLNYRLCSASGTYPGDSFQTNHAAILVSQKLIVSVWDESVTNAESILNAALLLSASSKLGFLKLYGFPFIHQIDTSFDEHLLVNIEKDIEEKIRNKTVVRGDVLPEFDCYQNAKGASLPLILSGMPYSKVENLINKDLFIEVSKLLEKSDNKHLLVATDLLVASSKLSCHFQFQSEANFYLLMAIEKIICNDCIKPSPLVLEWQKKVEKNDIHSTSLKMNPIEYIKLFNALIVVLKNSLIN